VTGFGALASISFYVASAAGTFRVGVYDNTGTNGPGKLVAQSGDITAATGWNTIPMPATELSQGTYWLYVLPSSNSLAFVKIAVAGDHNPFVAVAYGSMPAVFPTSTQTTDSEWSLYATVNITGGTSTSTQTTTTTPTTTTTTLPTTTTTTTTTNASGNHCFASPGSCGYPDPASGNVGVPAGTTLTNSGGTTVTTNGAVVNGENITGEVVVEANNVTIENSQITDSGGSGSSAVVVESGVSGLTIQDSTVHGSAATASGSVEHAVFNLSDSPVLIQRDYFYNCGDCIQYGADIENTYDLNDGACDCHYDPVYLSDGPVKINHSVLLNPFPQTDDVFGDTGGGSGGPCKNQITITNSLLAGGGYTLYECAHATSAGSSSLTFTNNRIARCLGTSVNDSVTGGTYCQGVGPTDPNVGCGNSGGCVPSPGDGNGYYPQGGYFGLDSQTYCAQATWSGNVWDDDGATVTC
jgi:hypothetical protein